jgi:hypothetical protein
MEDSLQGNGIFAGQRDICKATRYFAKPRDIFQGNEVFGGLLVALKTGIWRF